ncbi:HD-GYP domain-containing protein [Thalassotalea sp. PP2-459]|uniref:HD-GYP domain-containing protein n=1 Tax=Thalassotalea sp. PP2-459 TaxID=1742724 RepID=UPI0009442787|nr:HD-GYP domain-containing protein [Thalassotalea sp. PP2-459]OKY25050.1 phosphohydrolase [Thalassotalea sp. PP2-459]
MASSNSQAILEKIPLSNLTLGMYVTSIIDNDNIEIKSEGYVSDQETINQLKKANVCYVIVDTTKQKSVEKIDRVLGEITVTQTVPTKHSTPDVSLDQEMRKANKLYMSARDLQENILASVKRNRTLNQENISQTTDSLVDSVFRNQDALTCLTRLQSKDSYLFEHSLNVAILMSVFAKHLALEKRIVQELTLGAFLHDIGKVLIPKEILHKRGSLTIQEEKIMRSHVALGLKLLENSPEISHIAMRMIQEHHERADGSGYPHGLNSKATSKYGKMIAIVDSYDAMTCERPYKSAVSPISAFKTLVAEAPTKYDEELVEKFIQCLGVYPVGTLVKLNSGKLGLISQLNKSKPLRPFVKVFYNTRLNQAISIEEIDLSKSKYKDQIDCCIKPEDFNINLLGFFKNAFID